MDGANDLQAESSLCQKRRWFPALAVSHLCFCWSGNDFDGVCWMQLITINLNVLSIIIILQLRKISRQHANEHLDEAPVRDESSVNQHTSLCGAAGRTHGQEVSGLYKIPSQAMRGGGRAAAVLLCGGSGRRCAAGRWWVHNPSMLLSPLAAFFI